MYFMNKKAAFIAIALLLGLGATQQAQGMSVQKWAQNMLWEAIKKNDYRGIREALEDFHAQINFMDENGETPLLRACRTHKKATIIKFLIEKGAQVNVQDKNGEAPLTWPCLSNDTEIIKLLVDNGADTNIRNLFDQNLLEQACEISTSDEPINTLVAYGLEITPEHAQRYEPIISRVPLEYQILGAFHTNRPAFENVIALMVTQLPQRNTLDNKDAKEELNRIKSRAREYGFTQASNIIAIIERLSAPLNVQSADVEFSFDN